MQASMATQANSLHARHMATLARKYMRTKRNTSNFAAMTSIPKTDVCPRPKATLLLAIGKPLCEKINLAAF